uniref:Uncharacterized protein n=1 Tax=Romanomermis culicivorax TaxID=13658 RepID=A0A915I0G8_ROMCU
MQLVGCKQIEEEDVFGTNDEDVNDDNTCLTMQEKVLRQTELGMYLNMSQVDQCHQNKEDFCCNMCGQH